MRISDWSSDVCSSDLDHLKRQARAAEQYQGLKADHRDKEAQLKALEYRNVPVELTAMREQIGGEETSLEGLIADQRQAEAQIELCREQHAEEGDDLNPLPAESSTQRCVGKGVVSAFKYW